MGKHNVTTKRTNDTKDWEILLQVNFVLFAIFVMKCLF